MVSKPLLPNDLSIFFINYNPVFSNCPRRLQGNQPACSISGSYLFDNFILADELFAKTLQRSVQN